MCGIAGANHDWLLAQGIEPKAAMHKAVAELVWRGRDQQAIEHVGPWWLGCARLAISGPKSQQPVLRRSGRFAGVMNGAITNARDLWRTFLPGAEARAVPPNDAWLPVLAVAKQRRETLRTLRGHHAYAVVDRDTGELILGQDRYGEKPLHCLIARVGQRWQLVAFASTSAALRHLGMPEIHDHRRLAQWFRYGWSAQRPHRFTSRLRVDSVPRRGEPFTTATSSAQWCEPFTQPTVAASKAPTADLRDQLIHSVRRCIDSPSPSGLFLSGGVDSSCLAIALGAMDARIPAYQFCAKGASQREREAAEVVAMVARLPLRSVNGGPELLNDLPRLTRLAGQPLGDPSILAVHAVAKTAADDGVRIMLGGEGADELLLGYRRYRALANLPRLALLRKFGSRWSMHKAARYWRATTAKNPIRALLAVTPPAFANQILAPQLAERLCWQDAEPLPADRADLCLAARDDDLDNYLPRDLLPKVDIALLAAGIEGRCPYLEAGLEDFGQGRSSLNKRALREAFASELPNAVKLLPKVGFSLPLDDWFRSDPLLLELLAEPQSQQREHLRPGGLAAAIDRHRQGGTDLGHALYLLLAYELHLRANSAAETNVVTRA